jgi:hypothetical protein
MLYYEFQAGNKAYKLRLNTRNIVSLEKALGTNPLGIFGTGDRIPTVTEMVNVLHCSLQQFEHNISFNDAFDIFDTWLEDGNTVTDFITVIVDIYKTSGIIKDDKKEVELKNA